MVTLAERVDAAIRASGRTAKAIAHALGIDENTIGRIRSGKDVNPGVQIIEGIARETGTTVAALFAQSIVIAPEDEKPLEQFRRWIDAKLATIDALEEPNAEILREAVIERASRVADRRVRGDDPFGADAQLVLRAIGESMIGEGILPGDTLYAITGETDTAGKIVACRRDDRVFVKRLVTEHGRRFLISADRRYRAIAVDESFQILGVVIGRTGRVR
jgi:transcriptional regulator with XRE-family HTH domain